MKNALASTTTKTDATSANSKQQRGHVVARCPVIPLDGPGRLRTAHILAVCGFSHSTLYARLKNKTFPAPDGRDGGLNYWNTRTIRAYLDGSKPSEEDPARAPIKMTRNRIRFPRLHDSSK